MAYDRTRRRLVLGAFIAAVAASAAWLFVPAYGDQTLIQQEGNDIAVFLVIPVGLAALPMRFKGRHATRAVAFLMAAFVLVTGFSIGLFYLPSAVLLIAAASVAGRAGPESLSPAPAGPLSPTPR